MNSIHRVGLTVATLATVVTLAGTLVVQGYVAAEQAAAQAAVSGCKRRNGDGVRGSIDRLCESRADRKPAQPRRHCWHCLAACQPNSLKPST